MYKTLTQLVQSTIRRVRQVPGLNTQLYSEDEIAELIQEVYRRVRGMHYWDHLMKWVPQQLDGVNGLPVTPFTTWGIPSQRGDDVQFVCVNTSQRPLPHLGSINPAKLSGTVPRYIERLGPVDDPNGTLLFRVWPLTATTTPSTPLRVRVRLDPSDIFINPSVIVPFDSAVLINGAAVEYLGLDNVAARDMRVAYETRLAELERAHNNAPIVIDERVSNFLDHWMELN